VPPPGFVRSEQPVRVFTEEFGFGPLTYRELLALSYRLDEGTQRKSRGSPLPRWCSGLSIS